VTRYVFPFCFLIFVFATLLWNDFMVTRGMRMPPIQWLQQTSPNVATVEKEFARVFIRHALAPWAPRLFAWQAWHWATSTYLLHGRRGTW